MRELLGRWHDAPLAGVVVTSVDRDGTLGRPRPGAACHRAGCHTPPGDVLGRRGLACRFTGALGGGRSRRHTRQIAPGRAHPTHRGALLLGAALVLLAAACGGAQRPTPDDAAVHSALGRRPRRRRGDISRHPHGDPAPVGSHEHLWSATLRRPASRSTTTPGWPLGARPRGRRRDRPRPALHRRPGPSRRPLHARQDVERMPGCPAGSSSAASTTNRIGVMCAGHQRRTARQPSLDLEELPRSRCPTAPGGCNRMGQLSAPLSASAELLRELWRARMLNDSGRGPCGRPETRPGAGRRACAGSALSRWTVKLLAWATGGSRSRRCRRAAAGSQRTRCSRPRPPPVSGWSPL